MIIKKVFEARPGNSVLLFPDPPYYTIVDVSDDYVRTTGIEREQFLGKPLFEFFPASKEDKEFTGEQNIRASFETVLRTKAPHTIHQQRYDIPNADGSFSERYWKLRNVPVTGDDGEIQYIIHTSEDITALVRAKRSEEGLRGIEKSYNLFMNAPVIIGILKGDDYIIELANESLLEVWGRTEEVIGKPLFEAIPELGKQSFLPLLENVRETGEPFYAYEFPISLFRNGKEEEFYFDFVYKAIYDKDQGKASGIISVGHDVTPQVNARRRELENESKYRHVFEKMVQGFCVLEMIFDEDGKPKDYKFLEVNPMFESQTGLKEAVGKTALELVPNLEKHWLEIYGNIALTGKSSQFVEGSEAMGRWFDVNAFKIGGEESRKVALLFSDVTQQISAKQMVDELVDKRTRELAEANSALSQTNYELKRSNENLEEFAYAASHDLKEPMRKIQLFSDRLKEHLGDNLSGEDKNYLDRILHATSRMNTLIDDLLLYSHVSRGVVIEEIIDLNQKVKVVLNDIEIAVEEQRATVNVGKLPSVKGHRRQLQQLFQNLISNAIKYHKPGTDPVVNISSRLVSGEEPGLKFPAIEKEKQYHLIEVSDNGIGFEAEDAERIFNVFTRLHGNAEYKGTGVGLSIVRKVAENHGGYIWAESKPGVGTTFKVLLPVNT